MPFAWATNVQRIEVAVQNPGILNVTEDSFSDGGNTQ
jgi:dihydropteroate synthase